MTLKLLQKISNNIIIGIVYATPIFIVIIIPLFGVYWFVQQLYVATSRQLKRLESNSRSPIYSLFGETLSGVSTIRAYDLERKFMLDNEALVDHNQACYYPSMGKKYISSMAEKLLTFDPLYKFRCIKKYCYILIFKRNPRNI